VHPGSAAIAASTSSADTSASLPVLTAVYSRGRAPGPKLTVPKPSAPDADANPMPPGTSVVDSPPNSGLKLATSPRVTPDRADAVGPDDAYADATPRRDQRLLERRALRAGLGEARRPRRSPPGLRRSRRSSTCVDGRGRPHQDHPRDRPARPRRPRTPRARARPYAPATDEAVGWTGTTSPAKP